MKQDQAGYSLALYARASMEIKFVVAEIVDTTNGEVLGQARIEIESHNWKHYETRLRVQRDCKMQNSDYMSLRIMNVGLIMFLQACFGWIIFRCFLPIALAMFAKK